MQQTGRLLGQEYGDVKEFSSSLSFYCEVNGKPLTATIIAGLSPYTVTGYRIKFSDGYVSDFYANDFGYWTEAGSENDQKKKPSSYFFAIKDDLTALVNFEIYKQYYSFRLPVNGKQTNVFVIVTEWDGVTYHDVKYNGKYQFSLVKGKQAWLAGDRYDKKREIDQQLAQNISLLIESSH